MKIKSHFKYVAILAGIVLGACVQQTPAAKVEAQNQAAVFNPDLAAKLGADDYGMRSYVMVILKTGPMDTEITDEAKRAELFKGHFANMTKLAEEKKLALSGPFIDGDDKRGLFIFNVPTIAEAKALVQTDPAVAAGIFVPEFTKYYGSAALMQIPEVHKTLQKTKIE